LQHPIQKVAVQDEGKKSKMAPAPWENLCTVMGLNQLREHIGSVPMPPSAPGGRSWRHAQSINLALSYSGQDFIYNGEKKDDSSSAISQTIHFATIKNKTYIPRRNGVFRFSFEDFSINNDEQIVNECLRRKIMTESAGGNYQWGDQKFKAKREALPELIKGRKLWEKLKDQFHRRIAEEDKLYYALPKEKQL
jgi:hypothetical protein